jgi:bacteriorhodopsin
VQNTFFFVASALQIFTALMAGEAAHRDGLRFAYYIVAAMYFGAAVAAWWPVREATGTLQEQSDAAD